MNNINNNVRDVIEQAKIFNPNINDKQEENPNDVKVEVDIKHNDIISDDIDSARQKNILFASFDICGSTELKTRYKNNWIDMVEVLLTNKLSNMSFWKFNGDEILYSCEVHSLSFVIKLIHDISRLVDVLQDGLRKRFKESIFIKATVWIARVSFGKENDFKSGFQKICNYEFFKDELCDYVGINMDEGFRLCKHASPRKVVVDPKLVFLFLKSFLDDFYAEITDIPTYKKDVLELIDKTYFSQFVKCKGIWKDRKYPTYWYIEKDLEDNVHYDEVEDIEGFKSISSFDDEKNKEENIRNSYLSLKRIFKNVEVYDDIEKLVDSFRDYKPEDTQKRTESVANLYYMVTCINPATGNILLAKRSESRVHLKGVWDFGNVKFQKVDIPKYISDEYKNLFGVEISLDVDEGRGGNIVPHGCCKVYRNCNPHNGLLCHAIITDPTGTDEELLRHINSFIHDKGQYSEAKFIDTNMAKEFSKDELSIDEIRDDSEFASRGLNNMENTEGKYLMYIYNSVESAAAYYKKYKEKKQKDKK